MSIRTIKLPFKTKNSSDFERILDFCKNYNNVLRFTYNRLLDNNKKLSTKELTVLQKKMNNVFVDSYFLNSAQFEAKSLISKNGKTPVIFGGRKNFIKRCENKITKEEWQKISISPLCSIGEAPQKGNRKFQILSENEVLFKPNRNEHFVLVLPHLRKNLKKDLLKLKELQETKQVPITYKLDDKYIYISFENNKLHEVNFKQKIKDRIFAIDLNPNYIGWSVVDWENSENSKVVSSGVISNKNLNDIDFSLKGKGFNSESKERKYLTNKRNYENIDSANFLIGKAIHFQCELFVIEDLDIKSSDKEKGKRFNKLCNNLWNRNILENQLKKKCDLAGIVFQKVMANYSSFQGNLIYRKENLPDMCLSSIEIGRRGYEFYHQYILKDKEKIKNIIFNISEKAKEAIIQSLEELGFVDDFEDIKDLYYKIKTRKMKYRVPLENCCLQAVSSKKHIKSKIKLYSLS